MKILHEAPLQIINEIQTLTDGDYCIPAFMDKYPVYKQFFIDAKSKNRFIIMDNSLFEGYTHTIKDLVEKINLIKPNIFIIPDEWNNKTITYRNAKYWFNTIKPILPKETNLMVVLQGEMLYEVKELYRLCEDLGCTHFAFNHSSILYQNMALGKDKLSNQSEGRANLIYEMRECGFIKDNHYIHLLGASNLMEFNSYKTDYYNFINSIDTSSPIINGALGIRYNWETMCKKPINKIEEFMESDLTDKMDDIKLNISKFRLMCNN